VPVSELSSNDGAALLVIAPHNRSGERRFAHLQADISGSKHERAEIPEALAKVRRVHEDLGPDARRLLSTLTPQMLKSVMSSARHHDDEYERAAARAEKTWQSAEAARAKAAAAYAAAQVEADKLKGVLRVLNAKREIEGQQQLTRSKDVTNDVLKDFLKGKEHEGVVWSLKRSLEKEIGGRKLTHPDDKIRDELIHDARLLVGDASPRDQVCLCKRCKETGRLVLSQFGLRGAEEGAGEGGGEQRGGTRGENARDSNAPASQRLQRPTTLQNLTRVAKEFLRSQFASKVNEKKAWDSKQDSEFHAWLAGEVSEKTGRAFSPALMSRWWDQQLINFIISQGLKGLGAPDIADALGCGAATVIPLLPREKRMREGEGQGEVREGEGEQERLSTTTTEGEEGRNSQRARIE